MIREFHSHSLHQPMIKWLRKSISNAKCANGTQKIDFPTVSMRKSISSVIFIECNVLKNSYLLQICFTLKKNYKNKLNKQDYGHEVQKGIFPSILHTVKLVWCMWFSFKRHTSTSKTSHISTTEKKLVLNFCVWSLASSINGRLLSGSREKTICVTHVDGYRLQCSWWYKGLRLVLALGGVMCCL